MAKDIHHYFHPNLSGVGSLNGMPCTISGGYSKYYSSDVGHDLGDPQLFPPASAYYDQIYPSVEMLLSERAPNDNEACLINKWALPSYQWVEDNSMDFYNVSYDNWGKWKYTHGNKARGVPMVWSHVYGGGYYTANFHKDCKIPPGEMEITIGSVSNRTSEDYWALVVYDPLLTWHSTKSGYPWTTTYGGLVSSLAEIGGSNADVDQEGSFDEFYYVGGVLNVNSNKNNWTDMKFESEWAYGNMWKEVIPSRYVGEVKRVVGRGSLIDFTTSYRESLWSWDDYSAGGHMGLGYEDDVYTHDHSYAKILANRYNYWKTYNTYVLDCGLIIDGVLKDLPSKWRIPGTMQVSYLNYAGDYQQFIDDVTNNRTVDLRSKSKLLDWCRGNYEIPDDAIWVIKSSGNYVPTPISKIQGWPGDYSPCHVALVTGCRGNGTYKEIKSEGYTYTDEEYEIKFPRGMYALRSEVEDAYYTGYRLSSMMYPFDEALYKAYQQISGDFVLSTYIPSGS